MRIFGRARARLRDERGFGLIEAMFALGVFFATAVLMAYTATAAFNPTAAARERQAATGLADQALEQARALPFDTLKKGLDNTDLTATTDSNVVKNCNGVTGDYCYGGEKIPHSCITYSASACPSVPQGTTGDVPLVPHQRTITVRGMAYTVSTYVTYYLNDATTNTFRITSIVSWSSPEVHRSDKVQVQTIDSSPPGCLSTATHPFSAPCQPFLYANAYQDQGQVGITGTVQGFSLDHATLWTTSDGANVSLEQVSTVLSDVRSSGVDLQLTDDDLQIVGKTTTSASADNDPSQPANGYQSTTAANEASATLTASGGSNSLALTSSGADSGSTTSTTSSTYPSPSNACADTSGVNQTDGLPCANSSMKQGTNASPNMAAVLTLNGTSANLGAATIASIARAPSNGVAYVNRDVPSGDGLVHAATTRSLGTITIGGLPANVTAPAGWGGYLVRVTNFSDSVSADSGLNAPAPSVTRSGTISYWNGTGYSTMLVPTGAAVSIPVAAVHISYTQSPPNGPNVSLDIVPTLTTGGTGITDPAGCQAACNRTKASAQSSSPVVGDVTYTASYSGAQLCDLNLHVDLGQILAKTNYQAAPSG